MTTRAWVPRPRRPPVERPLPVVVVAGWTASGKTTLADRLCRDGVERVTGSTVLLTMLESDATSKAQRLLSWLADSAPADRDGHADRRTDLALLAALPRAGECVVESAGSLPLLLSPCNDALLIRLQAAPRIRAARLCRLLDDQIDVDQAQLIVERKDAATTAACLAAWGLDLTDPVHQRRYDLVVGCPDKHECVDPERCRDAVGALVDTAVNVYRRYLAQDRDGANQAMAHLEEAIERYRPWVRQVSTALCQPRASVSPRLWFERLTNDSGHSDVPRRGLPC